MEGWRGGKEERKRSSKEGGKEGRTEGTKEGRKKEREEGRKEGRKKTSLLIYPFSIHDELILTPRVPSVEFHFFLFMGECFTLSFRDRLSWP